MKKIQARPNSNHKMEQKNNNIFIPRVSSMIISEKIMQNLLRNGTGQQLTKNQSNQNSSPNKKNQQISPSKCQKIPNYQLNYLVTNTLRYQNPQQKILISNSFTKQVIKNNSKTSQLLTPSFGSSQIINTEKKNVPLHKLISKLQNKTKEKRSVSQLPTMSTDRCIQDTERMKKRKKSVRFHEQVEYLIIGTQEGVEEFKYKFFEPLEQQQ